MISDFFIIVAQAGQPPAPPAPPDTGMNLMIWMIFAFVLVYFMTIRPQRKRQLELEAQIKSLKTGDKVVTSGGIHGVIANVRDGSSLILKIADGIKIEVEKSAIATVLNPKSADAKS
jgi:preprotein translocase subunit YajC